VRLPDRPVLNGVLAVALAVLVLGFLSWPGIVGTARGSPLIEQKIPSTSPVLSSSSVANSGAQSSSSFETTIVSSSSSVLSSSSSFVSGSSNSPVHTGNQTDNVSLAPSSSPANTTVTTVYSAATTVMANTPSAAYTSSTPSTAAFSSSTGRSSISPLSILGALSVGSVVIAIACTFLAYRRLNAEEID
jgi:hypothetical protein